MAETPVESDFRFWRDCGGPVLVALGTFSLLNGLWNAPQLDLYDRLPQALPVYMGGSLVALALLWRPIRSGVLTQRDLGLATTGWTAPKRLVGLALILLMGFGGYSTLPPPSPASPSDGPVAQPAAGTTGQPAAMAATADAPVRSWPKPSWGDYCFWFVFLLAPSIAELLVFCSVAFCLTERCLIHWGTRPWMATTAAALFASFAFGLYHYTYEPRWWPYAYYPLMPVMLINLAYFALTRNFWLTLVLHNAFAAVGFTREQYSTWPPEDTVNPALFVEASKLGPVLIAFLVPFFILNLLEWKSCPRPRAQ